MNRFEILAHRQPFSCRVDFLLREMPRDGQVGIVQPLTVSMKPVNEVDGHAMSPTFSLPDQEAQVLLNELWREGFRPSSGEGSLGEIGALRAHLEDMRTLVFSPKPPLTTIPDEVLRPAKP